MANESKKQEFLSVAKWACKYAGVKLVFDGQGAWADVDKRVIHMPMRMAVDDIPAWIGIIVHESMHIKHTPKWLGSIARDSADKTIINAIEDERIEGLACKQLRALPGTLKKMVDFLTGNISPAELEKGNTGMQILGNFACKNSGRTPFWTDNTRRMTYEADPLLLKLKAKHADIIRRVTPTSYRENLKAYYAILDDLKKILKLDDDEKEQEQEQGAGQSKSGEKAVPQAERQDSDGEDTKDKENESIIKAIVKKAKSKRNSECKPSQEAGDGIDMEGMVMTENSIPLENLVKDRIKLALKKTLETTTSEGNILNTDELTSFMSGNVDDLFYDVNTEKKMRTKVYFLMDVSGSMEVTDTGSAFRVDAERISSRIEVAHGAFMSLKQVVDELKQEDGCDIESEAYAFGSSCHEWDIEKNPMETPAAGGGTAFASAMRYVTDMIMKDDPANKRILVVITDGYVSNGDVEATKSLLNEACQDIRVVFVRIGQSDLSEEHTRFFRHGIGTKESANTVLFEAFEEAI